MAYLAISTTCDDGRSAELINLIAEHRAWRLVARTESLILWTGAEGGPQVRPMANRGFVIGEIYDSGDGRPWPERAGPSHLTSEEMIADLCAHAFGRYVAILEGRQPAVFRDPSGGLDCLVWQIGPITLVSDDLQRLPPSLQPPRLALDWDVISQCAASASLAMTRLAFQGVCDVMPGTSRSMLNLSQIRTHWTPARFAGAWPVSSKRELAEDLAGRVDIAVKALISRHERLAVEVSGGLDSAVVAGSIARLGLQERVVNWLNYFTSRREGDERAYARSVTDQAGATLSPTHLPIRALAEPDFAIVAKSVRPAFNALVPARDEDTAQQMSSLRATALVSGQGGDAVFYQMPSALILSDELRAGGAKALVSPLLPTVARRLRRSIWSVIAEAWRDGARKNAGQAFSITALPREAARSAHPWISAAAQTGAGKRLQIIGLANAQVATGHCRISQIGDLLYPLTAQPVAEFCLGLPVAILTAGGKERGLARQAFTDRVPQLILERRKKGELTAFHAQTVAASLDFLRPHLLDGTLAEAGVLNRRHLEAALKPEQLLWRGEGSEILLAAALEAWVRHWQRYVPDSPQADRRRLQGAGAR